MNVFRALLVICLGGVASCNVEAKDPPHDCVSLDGATGTRGLLVVDTLYESTNIVTMRWDGQADPSLLATSSAPTGLSATLSGDVVVPRAAPPSGEMVVIDRASSVLTWITPATCGVRAQMSVGTFSANPHDYVEVGGTAFVSRYNDNPDSNPDLLERGGDILAIDPLTTKPLAAIDLHAWLDPTLSSTSPNPDHLLVLHGLVLVVMQNFQRGDDDAADVNIAVIDPKTLSVVATQTVTGLKNCNAIASLDADHAVLVCGGLSYQPTTMTMPEPTQGAASSGVAILSADSDGGLVVNRVIPASSITNQPLGYAVGVLDPTHVLVTTFGNADFGTLDTLLELDLGAASPLVATLATSTSPLDFGDVSCVSGPGCVLADANRKGTGRLRRFVQSASGMAEAAPLPSVDAFGLPPRNLGLL